MCTSTSIQTQRNRRWLLRLTAAFLCLFHFSAIAQQSAITPRRDVVIDIANDSFNVIDALCVVSTTGAYGMFARNPDGAGAFEIYNAQGDALEVDLYWRALGLNGNRQLQVLPETIIRDLPTRLDSGDCTSERVSVRFAVDLPLRNAESAIAGVYRGRIRLTVRAEP